jgi:hypothetical protein
MVFSLLRGVILVLSVLEVLIEEPYISARSRRRRSHHIHGFKTDVNDSDHVRDPLSLKPNHSVVNGPRIRSPVLLKLLKKFTKENAIQKL